MPSERDRRAYEAYVDRTARRHPGAEAQIAAAREPTSPTLIPPHDAGGLDDGHADHCRKADGTVILRKRPDAPIFPARQPPTDMEIAMQEIDHQIEQGAAELRCVPPPPKVLTTNHPEVTDPAERERLGLEPLDQRPRCLGTYGSNHGAPLLCSPAAGCGLRGCPWQRGSEAGLQRDLAHAVGALERIHKTVMPHRDPCEVTPDDIAHAVATLRIERDEARGWADRTKLQLEEALAKQRDAAGLSGDEREAWEAFCSAAAALEEHHERAQSLQGAYLGAQATLARVAAKRVRGR